MRISSTLFFQTGLNSINAQQSDLMHLYQQIGSGRRMVTPADDPLAAAQAINISQSQSLNQRYADNRAVAKQNLGIEDNTLYSVTNLLQDIKTRLVEAGNGTMSDADRATLSNVLANSRNTLLGLANATDGSGQYLFSGAKGGTAAFQDVNGKIVYLGDQGQRKIQADQARQISGGDVGSDIFNRAAPGTNSYLSRALDGNAGTGVMGGPEVTDPNGANIGHVFTVKFTSPTTYNVHVMDATGNTVQTFVNEPYDAASGSKLTLPGGVQVKFSGEPAAGDTFKVEPAGAPDYVAAAAGGNTGDAAIFSPVMSDYAVSRPGDVYNIRFTGVDEYEVSVTNPDPAYPDVVLPNQTFVPGRENTLTLPHGLQVKLTGSPAVDDTFTVQSANQNIKTDLNIFNTLDSIIAALNTPTEGNPAAMAAFQNTLATAMQRIDVTYDNVLTVRASVGTRLNELDAIDANGSQRSLNYSAQLSAMEDVDYYSTSTQLTLRTAALEAASLAFRKIQATSLFNMSK